MTARNHATLIRKAAPFVNASPDTVRKLSALGEVRRFSRHAPLWEAGALTADPIIVRSGVVREAGAPGDRAITLGLHGKGDLVGAECALGLPPGGGAEAYEDTVALQFPAEELGRLAAVDGAVALGLARLEAQRRLELQVRLGMVAHRTATQRLAEALIELGRRFGVRDSRGTIVNIRLTQQELASLIGATRETVSFLVSDLRRDKVIEREGKRIVLLDRRALGRLAAAEPAEA